MNKWYDNTTKKYIWKPVTNENDDENAEKDPQEVAENVHEHDRRQSHLWEIDCFLFGNIL